MRPSLRRLLIARRRQQAVLRSRQPAADAPPAAEIVGEVPIVHAPDMARPRPSVTRKGRR